MRLDAFAVSYPPKAPAKPPDNDDELRKLGEADGVRLLAEAPAGNAVGSGRPEHSKVSAGCHLWVIQPTSIPHIVETAAISPPLASGCAKHTDFFG